MWEAITAMILNIITITTSHSVLAEKAAIRAARSTFWNAQCWLMIAWIGWFFLLQLYQAVQ
jgi:hypothetical protein